MFQSPEWLWLELLVLVLVAIFLMALLGVYIYKKIHHLPTGECASCHAGSKKLLKQYHKMYGKKS